MLKNRKNQVKTQLFEQFLCKNNKTGEKMRFKAFFSILMVDSLWGYISMLIGLMSIKWQPSQNFGVLF